MIGLIGDAICSASYERWNDHRFTKFPLLYLPTSYPVLIFLISTSAATQCVRLLSDIVSAFFFSDTIFSLPDTLHHLATRDSSRS